MNPRERAQRIRQDSETSGERTEQLLEAIAILIQDLVRLGGQQVRGSWLPERGESEMTTQEAAQYLRVSERTLRRWAAEGLVPSVRRGGTRRFRREQIDTAKPAKKRLATRSAAPPIP